MQLAVVSAVAGVALACAGLASPLPAAAEPPDGEALYASHCSQCHGMDGAADTPAGKALGAVALRDPKFAGIEAEQVIHALRELPKHKAVSGKVSDAEIEAITAHIHDLAGGSE